MLLEILIEVLVLCACIYMAVRTIDFCPFCHGETARTCCCCCQCCGAGNRVEEQEEEEQQQQEE